MMLLRYYCCGCRNWKIVFVVFHIIPSTFVDIFKCRKIRNWDYNCWLNLKIIIFLVIIDHYIKYAFSLLSAYVSCMIYWNANVTFSHHKIVVTGLFYISSVFVSNITLVFNQSGTYCIWELWYRTRDVGQLDNSYHLLWRLKQNSMTCFKCKLNFIDINLY